MPRDLLLITLSLFTWGIGEGMFIYFQPIYLQQFGANPLAIGAILGAAGVAMAIAQIPAGYLGDRYGTRPLLRASWVIGVAATILMAVAPSLSVLTIGLLLYALTAFVTPPMNSYITHARGNWSVGRALSFASGTYQLGAVIGPVAGGFLAQHYGIGIIFRFSAVIFLVSTVIVFILRPQPIEPHDPTAPRAGFLHERSFILFLGIMFITILATYMPQPLT